MNVEFIVNNAKNVKIMLKHENKVISFFALSGYYSNSIRWVQ